MAPNRAVLAPMPSANDRSTTAVQTFVWKSIRAATRRSLNIERTLRHRTDGCQRRRGAVGPLAFDDPGVRIARMSVADEVIVRAEIATDDAMIRQVNEAAFAGAEEADLVDALRQEGVVLLSLVAEVERRIVGHILFSRMSVETADDPIAAIALAPLAVLPAYQRLGIGGALIQAGLDTLRGRGEQFVIVLGHPEYYSRFGFSTERARALESPFPPHAFMALALIPGTCEQIHGRVSYPRAFGL